MPKRQPLRDKYEKMMPALVDRENRNSRWLARSRQALVGSERTGLNDLRDELEIAMSDLAYFAQELPQDQVEQVFTVERVEPIIRAMLRLTHPSPKSGRKWLERSDTWGDEKRIYDIAAMLADLSLKKFGNYLQDADIGLQQLAVRDLNQARLWMKVAGIPKRQ